mmetsp:Transcript_31266/g.60398  ORF Transcript_31266/g.60398 Transcript_31266/m.60398 type:complete len:523 (+) Transcript_31266:66-1634(+)
MEPIGSVRWASEGDSDSVSLEENHASPCVNATAGCSTVPQMVEIQLDAELLGMLSRRSRRRIRDIQASCQVRTKLDKIRGTLQVVGSKSGIEGVKKQLESFSGPRKSVPTAVWAELMRTRMQTSTSSISVATLQEETGCRVHIERSRCEVRLFGDAQGVRKASERIDELASRCTETFVPLPGCSLLPDEQLQKLAQEHRVTFFQEARKIIAYGFKDAVAKAVVSLQDAIASQSAEATDMSRPEEDSAHCSTLSGSEPKQPPVLPVTVLAAVPPQAALPRSKDAPEHLKCSAGQVTQPSAHGTEKQQPFLAQADAAHFHGQFQSCPTCSAARFCTECGAPVGNHGAQGVLPPPAAHRVHWQQQQQQQQHQHHHQRQRQHHQRQQLTLPAGRKGSGLTSCCGDGARSGETVETDMQTASWMPPHMVLVPYDAAMAMQGTAAHCSPGMVTFGLVGTNQWYPTTDPGQMEPGVFMAPATTFAGQLAPVDTNTVSPQGSVGGHPSEESLPCHVQSNDSLPSIHAESC